MSADIGMNLTAIRTDLTVDPAIEVGSRFRNVRGTVESKVTMIHEDLYQPGYKWVRLYVTYGDKRCWETVPYHEFLAGVRKGWSIPVLDA